MARSPDVIVVGAGIIGCAVAWELARRGASVRIFESRTIGAGATQASAGVLAPNIEAGHGGPLLDLAVRSLDLYDDFVREVAEDSGIAIEYRRCGTLEIAHDDDDAARLQRRAETSQGLLQWLRADEVGQSEPLLATVRGALVAPRHGYVDAPVLTEALAWAAMRHNALIETGQRVTTIAADGDRMSIRTADGAQTHASSVVIAAGSWSANLSFPAASTPPAVHPVRGQLLRLRADAAPSRILWGPDCYIVPRDNGLVLVGATMEEVGFDERTTAAGVHDLLDAACELVPALWRASFVEARAGLRPATETGLPVIGRSPDNPNVFFATGHFRNGVLLAPLTARTIADTITAQP